MNLLYILLQISPNGYLTFGYNFFAIGGQTFPIPRYDRYIVAPLWSDWDVTRGGSITYQVYQCDSSYSFQLLQRVSHFISEVQNVDFHGTWMVVAHWEDVSKWGHSYNQVSKYGLHFSTNRFPLAELI